MKNIIFYTFAFCVLLSLYPLELRAQDTNNVPINQLYKEYCAIVETPLEISNGLKEKSHIAIDYAVEILKAAPDSIEAFLIFTEINGIEITDKVRIKYDELYKKIFSNLNDPNADVAEKLVFIRLMLMCFYDFRSIDEVNKNDEICNNALIRIKNECNDKRYAPLAFSILFLNKNNGDEYRKEFLEKYPNHPAIPYVEYDFLCRYWIKKELQKCIDETSKWCVKYSKLITPDGYMAAIIGYDLLTSCYVDLKDVVNAQKYYNLIKVEAPNYNNLYNLKKEIDSIKK